MKIIQTRVFQGANIYSHKKCIRIDVDLEGYGDIPSKNIPNFNFNLVNIIPELKSHRCGINEKFGFIKRLKEGTYLAHICEHTIIALQNRFNIDVSYGKAREIEGEIYYIIVQYVYKNTAINIINLAVDLINSLINNNPLDIEGRINNIKKILLKEEIGPSTNAICKAAKVYGLPVMEIDESGIYQIGYGKSLRRIEATISENTKCLAVDIACNKLLTKKILSYQNIPVPEGDKVFNIIDLLRKAELIGYPVVLKPQSGNKGKKVILNLKNEEQLVKAYEFIAETENEIIIEKFYEGNDYRVCVVNNKVVAVSKRIKPSIIGDGKNTVKELIQMINKNPMRGENHEKPLSKIKIDEELVNILQKNNIELTYIPKKDEKIILRDNANLSTGATAIDCTNEICAENIDYCLRAANAIGLDICGIDICTEDISKSLNSNNGVIIEVNAAPGIRMHLFPQKGIYRDIGHEIINMLYNNKPSNIPVVSITGTNGKTTTARLISYTLRNIGYKVGMTSTEGIFINDKCIHKGDDSGFSSARSVLMNPEIDVAVLETARGGIIKKGLAYEKADVAVITNITNDHLGLDNINSMEELSFVKSLVAEAVKEDGFTVINADDEYARKIIKRIKNEKIYYSKYKDNYLIRKNIEEGKCAVFVEDNKIKVTNNYRTYDIIDCFELPISYNNILEYNIENAMAACAALVGLKVDYCIISKSFSQFKLNDNDCRGRFNIFEYENRKIILDYGHNLEGYRSVFNSLKKLNSNKLIGVIGVPGDRQNGDIKLIGQLCAENLSEIIIKEDVDKRGRKEGEVAEILYKSVTTKNKKVSPIICLDEVEALEYAINISEENDIIIVFFEKMEPLLNLIRKVKIKDKYKISNS